MGGTARFNKYFSVAISTTTSSTSFVQMGGTVTFVAYGGPVQVGLIPDPASGTDITSIGIDNGAGGHATAFFRLARDGGAISRHYFDAYTAGGTPTANFPLSMVFTLDQPLPGSHTYAIYGEVSSALTTLYINNALLVVWEL